MPSIKNIETINAVAEAYTSNGHNKTNALRTAGYNEDYAHSGGGMKIYSNLHVIAAIKTITDKTSAKVEHTLEQAIEMLAQNIAWLTPRAESGDVPSIRALTDACRELDSICGHNKAMPAPATAAPTITDQERAALELAAKRLTSIRIHPTTNEDGHESTNTG